MFQYRTNLLGSQDSEEAILQNYTAFLLGVRSSQQPRFFFLQLFVPNDIACHVMAFVPSDSIFVEHTCCVNVVNSNVGKQTKKSGIVIHKYIKTGVGGKYSISGRTTFSPNRYLIEKATCFPFFAP